jgi:FkbM family methyltransferase
LFRFFTKKKKRLAKLTDFVSVDRISDLRYCQTGQRGRVRLGENYFHFHEALSLYVSYQEILEDKIYAFKADTVNPLIIDCGANMGVSVLFFSQHYPGATIHAFEPEAPIYEILEQNVRNYGLTNVTLHQKAVWTSETTLQFFTDKGMGGSVENVYKNQKPVEVATVRLADFLQQPVDLLKLDIEGAEYAVLKDCELWLKNVKNLFVEYHSFINKEQKLEEILAMLKEAGFRYHLRQSFSRARPFVDSELSCENMDMSINVFAYRHQ